MLFGDEDINTTTNSQYIMYPSSINSVTVSAGGTNYSAGATQITISGGGGSCALALPTVSGDAVTAITMGIGGSNYNCQPNVLITLGVVNTSSMIGGSCYVLEKTQTTVSDAGGSGLVITRTITSNAISALT